MDYIALILVLTLSSGLLLMIIIPLYLDKAIPEDREILIKTSMLGIYTILTTWFGAKIQGQRDKDD